jgi:hypothetical protein
VAHDNLPFSVVRVHVNLRERGSTANRHFDCGALTVRPPLVELYPGPGDLIAIGGYLLRECH